MDKEFKTQKSFETYVKKNILTPLIKDLTKEIHKELYDYVEKEWYESNSGRSSFGRTNANNSFYTRTYSFLNNLIKTDFKSKGHDFSMKIYFDYANMSTVPPEWGSSGFFTKFGSRVSLNGDTSYEGASISKWLIQWIEEGQKSKIYSYDGIHMFKTLDERLRQDLDTRILLILNKYGVMAEKG